jgi:hypothetical protein
MAEIVAKEVCWFKSDSHVIWKPGDSHFWAGIVATKKYFFLHCSFSIRDGSDIRFWEDKWLGSVHNVSRFIPSLWI